MLVLSNMVKPMNKADGRKLRDMIKKTRKQFARIESRVWTDEQRLKATSQRDLDEVDSHREIGCAINQIMDAMETATVVVQEAIYGLRNAPHKSRNR